MITISWRLAPEGIADFNHHGVTAHETTLPQGEADPAADIVEMLILGWLGERPWREVFQDYDAATVLIQILAPPAFAGIYRVNLERMVEVTSKKIGPVGGILQ